MTENEAIKIHIAENIHRIEVIENFMHSSFDADKESCRKNISVLTKINGLLDEIQQYRAIGTVMQVEAMKKLCGLQEELLKQYQSIGTVEECRAAVERMKPRKPITYKETNRADCPKCSATVRGIAKPFGDFCSKCGQAIDWDEGGAHE